MKKLARLTAMAAGAVLLVFSQYVLSDFDTPWIQAMLIAPLAVGLAHFILFEILVAPYLLTAPRLFTPRNLRAQFAARRGLLWQRLDDRHADPQRGVAFFREALALTEEPELRNALENALSSLEVDWATYTDAEAELAAALKRTRLGNPVFGLRIPIKKMIPPVALLGTWTIAVFLWASQPNPALQVDIIPLVLAMFWLIWALGLLAYEVWYAWKTALCFRHFTTVLVSDSDASTVFYPFAQDLYWRVGKLIVVHVNGGEDAGVLAWVVDGNENFAVPEDRLEHILDVLSGEADLAVAQTENQALAEQVLEKFELSEDRRLVLSSESTAPTGCRWIEQTTLMIDPSRSELFSEPRPTLTRYDRRLPGEGFGWHVSLSLVLGLAALWVPGATLASALLVVCAIAPPALRPIAVNRRTQVSREMWRAPKAPDVSARLEPGKLSSRLGWAGAALGLPPAALIALHHEWPSEVLVIFVTVGAMLGSFVASNATLFGMRLYKWRLDRDFRIVVFRRNSDTFGYALIEHVMGTLGKYGQVLLLDHETVQSYKTGYRNDHRGNTSHWSYYFAEPDLQIQMSGLRPDWRRTCLIELELADFAVFDWSEEVTAAMAWELEMAGKMLPSERILVVLNKGVSAVAPLAALPPDVRDRIRVETLPRGSDDQYGWADHSGFAQSFSEVVAGMMAAIAPKPRTTRIMAIRGAWPFPTDCLRYG